MKQGVHGLTYGPSTTRLRMGVIAGVTTVATAGAAAAVGLSPFGSFAGASTVTVVKTVSAGSGCAAPKPTATKTITAPPQTVTATAPPQTVTATAVGPTQTVSVPGPTTTVTSVSPGPATTITTISAGPTTTVTTTIPAPTQTVTATEISTVAAPTDTITTTDTEVVTSTSTLTATATVTVTATATVTASRDHARHAQCSTPLTAQRLSLGTSAARTTARGAVIVFSGVVKPHHNGFLVVQHRHDGVWTDVAFARSATTTGHYSKRLLLPFGTYRARVVALPTHQYGRAASRTVRVHVKP